MIVVVEDLLECLKVVKNALETRKYDIHESKSLIIMIPRKEEKTLFSSIITLKFLYIYKYIYIYKFFFFQ